MCVRLHDEGFAPEQTIDVVTTTRPLVTPHSLEALAQMQFYKGRIKKEVLEAAVASNDDPLPIGKGKAGCVWHGVAADAPHRNDTVLLELSAPFLNPFGRGGEGLFARLSLAGDAATWYWIPIVNRNGIWLAGQPMLVGLHD